ncbi:hypothetical protein AU198_14525 [Mycobacterium sp. GA-1199]|uniref:hypothetical protein n=1 Tax=Mycobacterium sp. GA-1199 TaxID=1772287 RepID=UPI0007483369|nr:hypothetical protein [Mycobacterium sp. GA-1199]KUI44747.1 hypothetical protein AU198_14525 [Mycobacterium sp. GA-1199]
MSTVEYSIVRHYTGIRLQALSLRVVMLASMARTRKELLEYFEEQLGFLERSNAAYDAGHVGEAKRLAQAVRVLLHHTAPRYSSHAVVNQLGLENILTWVDTAGVPDPRNLLSTPGLTRFKMTAGDGSDPEYEPKLGDYPPSPILTAGGRRITRGSRIAFSEWWTNTVIKDAAGTGYSRRKLVLALSNKEGGAHVDPIADADYEALAKSNSLGWSVTVGDDDPRPLAQNPVFPSMRQISYEVLESIRQQRDQIK